ncbi:hypothetical protein BDV19DRAFT_374431 [Aspergillus venezuelensis]
MIMPSSSFLFDSPVPPQLDLVGAPSPLFQVPPTPSASSALYRSISASQRKRCRPELEHGRVNVRKIPHRPPPMVNDFFADIDESYDHEDHDIHRPSRYRDYPRTPLDASFTDSGKEPDDFRRKRCRREDPSSVIAASPSGLDEKAMASQMPTEARPMRWSRAVLNVVGRVWDFCWSGPFRGFYAGGGRGYALDPPEPAFEQAEGSSYHPRPSSSSSLPSSAEKASASVPGEYPRDGSEDTLRGNWVMVSPSEGAARLRHHSPSARPRSRRCHVTRGRVVHRRTPSKKSLVPQPASTHSAPAKPHESPVSVETQRYLAKQRRMEREEDASLRRLNKQLQAMIQEGKQALGTRIEIDEEMDMDMGDY